MVVTAGASPCCGSYRSGGAVLGSDAVDMAAIINGDEGERINGDKFGKIKEKQISTVYLRIYILNGKNLFLRLI